MSGRNGAGVGRFGIGLLWSHYAGSAPIGQSRKDITPRKGANGCEARRPAPMKETRDGRREEFAGMDVAGPVFLSCFALRIHCVHGGKLEMLVLSRKRSQEIHIDGGIRLTVVSIRGDKVRIGIEAPDGTAIVRPDAVDKTGGCSNGPEEI